MALRKKLDIKQLLKKNYTNSKVLQNLAYGAAKQKSDKLKKDFLKDFDAHPVTREIKQGPSGMASSLLGGRGNFFGFLGFNSGQQPIEILRDQIENNITILNKKGKIKKISSTSFVWQFDISVPSKADIYNLSAFCFAARNSLKRFGAIFVASAPKVSTASSVMPARNASLSRNAAAKLALILVVSLEAFSPSI